LLGRRHAGEGIHESARSPLLHFSEDEQLAPPDDEIDFAVTATMVAGERKVALLDEKGLGDCLRLIADNTRARSAGHVGAPICAT
jgi:hypothetical protein